MPPRAKWQPTEIRRELQRKPTSTSPFVVETDCGRAVVKFLGNSQGPHALAREFVGTKLAASLELRTFDVAILEVAPEEAARFRLAGEIKRAVPGAVFATRFENGTEWGGSPLELLAVQNRSDISGVIVFDTLIRNKDRWPGLHGRPNHGNVYLSAEGQGGDRVELVVMDHTHCFISGDELIPRALRDYGTIHDTTVYGAFPAYLPYWDATATADFQIRLANLPPAVVESIVSEIPRDWEVDKDTRKALVTFLCERAGYLAGRPALDFRPKEEQP